MTCSAGKKTSSDSKKTSSADKKTSSARRRTPSDSQMTSSDCHRTSSASDKPRFFANFGRVYCYFPQKHDILAGFSSQCGVLYYLFLGCYSSLSPSL